MATVTVEPIGNLALHATIPIAFSVDRMLRVDVLEDGLRGVALSEVPVAEPWTKDYDAIKGEGPTRWATSFDVSNWGLIAAYDGSARVGGAIVAFNTAGVNLLEGRSDLAVLWDIRVRPEYRGTGVGTLLFRAVEDWALDRGCTTIKIETQNINLPACRFYRRAGCTLGAIDRFAYADLPDEVRLTWVKRLATRA